MAHFANKQYVMKMVEYYGFGIVRSRKRQSLAIMSFNGKIIIDISEKGTPEKAWESIWCQARMAVEKYTGISIMDDWQNL